MMGENEMRLDWEIIKAYREKMEKKRADNKCSQWKQLNDDFLNRASYEWAKNAINPFVYIAIDFDNDRIIVSNWGISWKEQNEPFLDYRIELEDIHDDKMSLIRIWDNIFLLNPNLKIDTDLSVSFADYMGTNKFTYENIRKIKRKSVSLFDDDYNSRRAII